MKNYLIFAAFLLLVILQGAILLMLYKSDFSTFQRTEQIAVTDRDTVIKLVPSKPIVLEKVKSKIVYTKDTLILTKPFTASTDTIILRDTVHAKWTFPEQLFSLEVKRPPDTLKSEKMFIVPAAVKQVWWEKAAYFGAGTILAIIIKSL